MATVGRTKHGSKKNFYKGLYLFAPGRKNRQISLCPKETLSRLLIYKEGEISEDVYKNISQHIPENALLIFNNTKVVEARLLFQNQLVASLRSFVWNHMNNTLRITTGMLQKGKCYGIAWWEVSQSGKTGRYWKRKSHQ